MVRPERFPLTAGCENHPLQPAASAFVCPRWWAYFGATSRQAHGPPDNTISKDLLLFEFKVVRPERFSSASSGQAHGPPDNAVLNDLLSLEFKVVRPERFPSAGSGQAHGLKLNKIYMRRSSIIKNGAPREIRTPDLRIRSPLRYPAALWAHGNNGLGHRARGIEKMASTRLARNIK
jgi:hypothetical protein